MRNSRKCAVRQQEIQQLIFFFFCWCYVILGHLLNPSAAVFLCPKRRSDLPHVCVCVCVCVSALAGWRTQGSSVWIFSSFLRPLSRHH